MVGSDEPEGADRCCRDETGAEACVDSVEAAGRGCEFEPLQPRSHAIIKTEEKIVFKSGFINTTLTHAL
jgi:hypothetical protein